MYTSGKRDSLPEWGEALHKLSLDHRGMRLIAASIAELGTICQDVIAWNLHSTAPGGLK